MLIDDYVGNKVIDNKKNKIKNSKTKLNPKSEIVTVILIILMALISIITFVYLKTDSKLINL